METESAVLPRLPPPRATLPAPAQTKEKTADPNKHQEQYGLV